MHNGEDTEPILTEASTKLRCRESFVNCSNDSTLIRSSINDIHRSILKKDRIMKGNSIFHSRTLTQRDSHILNQTKHLDHKRVAKKIAFKQLENDEVEVEKEDQAKVLINFTKKGRNFFN